MKVYKVSVYHRIIWSLPNYWNSVLYLIFSPIWWEQKMSSGWRLGCIWTRLTYDRMHFIVNLSLFDLYCGQTLKPVYNSNGFHTEIPGPRVQTTANIPMQLNSKFHQETVSVFNCQIFIVNYPFTKILTHRKAPRLVDKVSAEALIEIH